MATTRWCTTIAAWALRRPTDLAHRNDAHERLGPARHARRAGRRAPARAQGLPVATLGHSIGGQFLGLLTNHALARAHVQIATSVGYWRWEHAPFKYLAWWFWRVHGPLMLALKGYVPTGGGWAGLPLPRGVYEEWRRWCLRPGSLRPRSRHLSSRQLFRRDPRARAHRRIHRRSDRDAPHRRGAATSSFRTSRASRAGTRPRTRRLEAHRARRLLRLAPSRHPVAARHRLDRRASWACAHERFRVPAHRPITSRRTTGWRSTRRRSSRCWRRAHAARRAGRIFRRRAARRAREARARHDPRTRRRAAPRRRVYVLPGIMGSQLGFIRGGKRPNDILWLDPIDIAFGRLTELKLHGDVARRRARRDELHAISSSRCRCARPASTPCCSTTTGGATSRTLGKLLAERIAADGRDEVALIGHSMGGLVARAALMHAAGKRVSQLDHARHAELRVRWPPCRRCAAPIRWCARSRCSTCGMTRNSSRATCSRVFPGCTSCCRPTRASAISTCSIAPRGRAAVRARTPRCCAPPRASTQRMAPADARFHMVVGCNRTTATGVALRDGDFEYEYSLQGDGTVPIELARLAGRAPQLRRVRPQRHAAVRPRDRRHHRPAEDRRHAALRRRRRRCKRGSLTRVRDAELREQYQGKIDWPHMTPEQRRLFLDTLNEAPRGRTHQRPQRAGRRAAAHRPRARRRRRQRARRGHGGRGTARRAGQRRRRGRRPASRRRHRRLAAAPGGQRRRRPRDADSAQPAAPGRKPAHRLSARRPRTLRPAEPRRHRTRGREPGAFRRGAAVSLARHRRLGRRRRHRARGFVRGAAAWPAARARRRGKPGLARIDLHVLTRADAQAVHARLRGFREIAARRRAAPARRSAPPRAQRRDARRARVPGTAHLIVAAESRRGVARNLARFAAHRRQFGGYLLAEPGISGRGARTAGPRVPERVADTRARARRWARSSVR